MARWWFGQEWPDGVELTPHNQRYFAREEGPRRQVFVDADAGSFASIWTEGRLTRITGFQLVALKNMMYQRVWLKSCSVVPNSASDEYENHTAASKQIRDALKALFANDRDAQKRWFRSQEKGIDREWRFEPPEGGTWGLLLSAHPEAEVYESNGSPSKPEEFGLRVIEARAKLYPDGGGTRVEAWVVLAAVTELGNEVLSIHVENDGVPCRLSDPDVFDPEVDMEEAAARFSGVIPKPWLPLTHVRVEPRSSVRGRLTAWTRSPKPGSLQLVIRTLDDQLISKPIHCAR